ncbi:hypothetical protein WOLCODRAFT_137921 [Wolfiporia cocos MD-104 SS10]|uniref:SH3 domain-containing protein n=1 Tax=Wolfiporia cocos (strain MD-104) TaxID=742152 RepID=A0A2H3K239_WOLCO|nr:hypothetical protein WOLCODRAFT_137921 [Wolfiporia cocos MD-104 SS10]
MARLCRYVPCTADLSTKARTIPLSLQGSLFYLAGLAFSPRSLLSPWTVAYGYSAISCVAQVLELTEGRSPRGSLLMPPRILLLPRQTDNLGGVYGNTTDSFTHDDVQLAGLGVALAIALGGALWLAIHFYRRRRAAQREDDSAVPSAAYTVVVPLPNAHKQEVDTFSKEQASAELAPPQPAFLRKDAAQVQIHESPPTPPPETRTPTPEARSSVSEARPRPRPRLPSSATQLRASTLSNRSSLRPNSGVAFLDAPGPSARPHTPSRASSRSHSHSHSPRASRRWSASSASALGFDGSHRRKVRQAFRPTRADELAVRAGERVALVQAYVDGWCIVGRESTKRRGDIELGAVPLWVFVAAADGCQPERPKRSVSLSVAITLDAPGGPCFKWSNKERVRYLVLYALIRWLSRSSPP